VYNGFQFGQTMKYTIKQMADLAGVTTRTLRYYDEVELLTPVEIGENGYRYYDNGNLLQLQQIMFYRELDVPVKDIQFILSRPDHQVLSALENQRQQLQQKIARLIKLVETIDHTMMTMKGEWIMRDEDYFEGFDEVKYMHEAEQRWGNTPQYQESMKKWASYTEVQKETINDESKRLTHRMVSPNPQIYPDDPDVQTAIGQYFDYLNKYFYTCDIEFLRSLADMWVSDPRFAENYERIRKGGAVFVREAVHIYCDRHS
jgi:DNA-binding transcriptional MerR regulator